MRNIEPGFRVVGSDGREIGTVASCTRTYCEVDTGILGLGHPLYVPLDAIQQTEGNIVILGESSERVSELDWSRPPAVAGQPEYYGTLPAEQTAEATPGGVTEPVAAPAPGVVSPGAPPPRTPGELSPAAILSVQPGWKVMCSDGRQVGTVASARPDGLEMERGWFIFRHRLLVPRRTIGHVDEMHHLVYLNVDCATVNRFHSV
jgi:hypothetical protein